MGKENRKKLRNYLKNYRSWQAQAKDIEKAIACGDVAESLKELLITAKNDFVRKCGCVRLILGYTKDGIERQIMTMLYIDGYSMKEIAGKLRYSYGHCANIEFNSIIQLSKNATVMQLLV